ncbi:MAG: aminotransferase class IV [Gemmatimonadetes bacterium]|nr:aminotransferase class IV [Gemmatimonadota bacterium]
MSPHSRSAAPLCWARGVLRPATEFRPHVGDRAFRYGDGVFATLLLEQGFLLDADAHVQKLTASADAIGLTVPEPVSSAPQLCEVLRLMGADDSTDAVVRIQVSCESGGRGYDRGECDAWELVELHALPGQRVLSVAILEPGEAPIPAMPAIKSCSALAHVTCARAARRRGVVEAVRCSGDHLLEASSSNLFWEANGDLFTPSASLPLYPGVTRSVVVHEARRSGWTVHEGEFARSALERAGGAFLTNAVRGVEPVAELGGMRMEWAAELEALRAAVQAARIEGAAPLAP